MKFLFDLGGVFFDWNPKYFYKNVFSDSKEMDFFLSKICNDSWNSRQDEGRSIEDGENQIINLFPKFKKQIKMYYKNHKKMIKGVFKNSIEILTVLKKNNYKCYVLSNWSSETFMGMTEEYTFLKQFDDMIISGEHKLIKPNPLIYKLAINKFNLDPLNCVFIDDKYENIDAAKQLGFLTIHLINPRTIKSEIEKFII